MNKWHEKAAILSISLLMMGITAVSPALAKLANAFPDASYSTVSLIVTLPSVLLIPFSVLSGVIAERWNNKLILSVGLVIYTLSGISAVFVDSLPVLLIARCFFGAGLGIITPFCTGFIANFFDGAPRVRMLGFQSAAVSVGSIITNFAAGFLSANDWHKAFWVYILGFAVLVLVLLWLPNPKERDANDGNREHPTMPVYLVSLKIFLFIAVYIVFFTHTALVMAEGKIGDTVSSGLTITIGMVGGLTAGIFFSRICRYFGKYTAATALASAGSGFLLLGFGQNLGIMIIGSVFVGAGFSLTSCNTALQISLVSPKSALMASMGIMLAAVNVGQFVSPFFSAGVGRVFGNDSGRLVFMTGGVLMLAAFVVSAVKARRNAGHTAMPCEVQTGKPPTS